MRQAFPVETPFETATAAREYLEQKRLVCLRCGRSYKRLVTHLLVKHGWTVDEYKRFYALPLSRGLECRDTADLRIEHVQRHLGGVDMRAMRRNRHWSSGGSSEYHTRVRAELSPPHVSVCGECGSHFKTGGTRQQRQYCSSACSNKSRRYADRPCERCGSPFVPGNSHAKYCCKACKRAAARDRQRATSENGAAI